MALKIRLQRGGRNHKPVYRVVVAESSARRDGRFVESVGTYNPSPMGQQERYNLKLDRIDYWASVGAKPTDTVKVLIRKARKETAATAESK